MKVEILSMYEEFFHLDYRLPFFGLVSFRWDNPLKIYYQIINCETRIVVKSGFQSYEQAEHWASEQNYTVVTE